MTSARSWAGLMALAAACASGNASPASGGAEAHATSRSRCDDLVAANERALAAIATAPDWAHELREAGRCRHDGKTAWGLTFDRLTSTPEGFGRFSIVHVDERGHTSTLAPATSRAIGGEPDEQEATGPNLSWSATEKIVPSPPLLFDYDGDGVPEAVVIVRTEHTTEAGVTHAMKRGQVWTVRDGRIRLYSSARAFAVESAADVDGDGRLDLATRGPYADLVVNRCGSGEAYPAVGPLLIARSVPNGGFEWVRGTRDAGCTRAPDRILAPDPARPAFVDSAASARNVACARLWGAAAAPIERQLREGCGLVGSCSRCDDAELLVRWARVQPPVRFR